MFNGGSGRRLADGDGEERVGSSVSNPWQLWDWQWDRLVCTRPRWFQQVGLKPFHVKKLERWCEPVCERVENMLTNTPAAEAVLSSEELNVVAWSSGWTTLVEVKQFKSVRIRVRVAWSSDKLTQLLPPWAVLASSIRLTMTIRRSLTLTTLNYRYSHSLTNEACGSTVSR